MAQDSLSAWLDWWESKGNAISMCPVGNGGSVVSPGTRNQTGTPTSIGGSGGTPSTSTGSTGTSNTGGSTSTSGGDTTRPELNWGSLTVFFQGQSYQWGEEWEFEPSFLDNFSLLTLDYSNPSWDRNVDYFQDRLIDSLFGGKEEPTNETEDQKQI